MTDAVRGNRNSVSVASNDSIVRAAREVLDAPAIAQSFHETYERLAPSFGYTTRPESRVPWQQVPEQNRKLMVAVVDEVVGPLADEVLRLREERLDAITQWERADAEVRRLREALECEHNRNVEADPERLWEYVEHKGKTWNRCRSCGLLELWEGGSFIGIDFAALASSPDSETTERGDGHTEQETQA